MANSYLITGVAGFIASGTARMLLNQGHHVVGIDNMNDYYDVRLKQHRLDDLGAYPGFTFKRQDIEDRDGLGKIFQENSFHAVFNLAARAGVRPSMDDPFVYMSTNATGTLNILDQMLRHDVPKLVLASTSSLYAGQPMPFIEDLPVNTPISPYAASKKAAEVMAYTYHHLYGIDVSIVRYFTVYGPAGRPDMAALRFIKCINEGTPIPLHGDGSQSRDFTYVDDIAEGTIKAAQPLNYEIINLGGGNRPISITRLIELIEENIGKKAVIKNLPFHKADMVATWADISKADRLLRWHPKVEPADGVARTVDWYLKNESWLREIPF